MTVDSEIAIVGIGCRFPGANNVQEFWRVLSQGENHIVDIPDSRWNSEAFYDEDPSTPGKTYVRKAGLVDGFDEWNHKVYEISQEEAEVMDPQQRMVLDCVQMAMEDGGITRKDLYGSKTSVYIGVMTDDYKGHVMDYDTVHSPYTVTGSHSSIISARVSHIFHLLGPAVTVDTACSSSIFAMHLGSRDLMFGTCSTAICGGVNLLLDPQTFIALCRAGMLSPDGQCKAFTKDANGYARAEGCGMIILKRLDDAIRDGNKIWGTIKTSTNQDGRTVTPITCPSSEQQLQLLKETYSHYKIEKSDIQVIEAHGTGTAIGDPREVKALGTFFEDRQRQIFLGSVKTNIGHLEAASGVAGLIKVLLMMLYRQIVKSLWYSEENENPSLKLRHYGFVVPTKNIAWETKEGKPRMACLNSFGFGGTNTHAIIQQYQDAPLGEPGKPNTNDLPPIVVTSAVEFEDLYIAAESMAAALQKQNYDLNALSCTSTCKRPHFPYRKAFFGDSQEELIRQCHNFASKSSGHHVSHSGRKNIVFVFCGVGTTWTGMSKRLLENSTFLKSINEVDKFLVQMIGWRIKEKLQAEVDDVLENPIVSHIAIFAYQVGLVALWKQFGVEPNAVVGQSVGEVAAAYAAGIIDLETAVQIIVIRSKSLASVSSGTMAVVKDTDVKDVKEYCKTTKSLCVAVYNSPSSCTVSGEVGEIEQMEHHFKERCQASVIYLKVPCAYHSCLVNDAATNTRNRLGTVKVQDSNIPIYSTVLGSLATHDTFADSEYWRRNVRDPVQFSKAVIAARSKSDHTICLEIGPSPVLSSHMKDLFSDTKDVSVVASVRRNAERETLAKAVCSLYELGVDIKWGNIFQCQRYVTDIPIFYGRKIKHLYQAQATLQKLHGLTKHTSTKHPFVSMTYDKHGEHIFEANVNKESSPYVYEHVIQKQILLPGAFHIEIGNYIGKELLQGKDSDLVVSLEFLRPLVLLDSDEKKLEVSTEKYDQKVTFHVESDHKVLCTGTVSRTGSMAGWYDVRKLEVAMELTAHKELNQTEVYDSFSAINFNYGRNLQLIKHLLACGHEALSQIDVPEEIMEDTHSMGVHPCIIDAMLQTSLFSSGEDFFEHISTERHTFLPVAVGELYYVRKPEKRMMVYTRMMSQTIFEGVFQAHYNMILTDTHGTVIAEIRNFMTSKRFSEHSPSDLSYELVWEPAKMAIEDKGTPRILFLSNQDSDTEGQLFSDHPSVFSYNGLDGAINGSIENAFVHFKNRYKLDDIETIIFFVKCIPIQNVTSKEDCVYKQIKENCLLLVDLLRYVKKAELEKPVYIVTENTQPLSKDKSFSKPINCVGSEVWGFVRSANVEFVADLSLVDVQPSLSACKDRLLEYISQTSDNIGRSSTEVLLTESKLYFSEFSKVGKCLPTPLKRKSLLRNQALEVNHRLIMDIVQNPRDVHLTPALDDTNESSSADLVKMRVTSVTALPSWLYPQEQLATKLDNDPWSGTSGYPYFALEHRGYMCNQQVTSKLSLLFESTNPFQTEKKIKEQAECLAFFPTTVSSEMYIPSKFIVQQYKRRFKPGELMYAFISWQILKQVPVGSTVVIFDHNNSALYKILKKMLKTRKHADVKRFCKSMNVDDRDILILVDKVHTRLKSLLRFKTVLCLHQHLSKETQAALFESKEHELKIIHNNKLMDEKVIERDLCDVVSWLNNYTKDVVPSESIDIMDKNSIAMLPVRHTLKTLFSKTDVYIVTGGLSGLGWELTKLMAEFGAGNIVTMTRRKPDQDIQREINELDNKYDCKVSCRTADVNDLVAVKNVISSINGQIKGIFHCAGLTKGRLIEDMSQESLEIVLKPKVLGTLNLHLVAAELGLPLEFFVIASSISSLIGSPGQTNYGAANSFVDAFATMRREQGLPCQAINWGALEIGMAANPEFAQMFEKRGFNLMSTREIRNCFLTCLLQDASRIVFADMNWDTVAQYFESKSMQRVRAHFRKVINLYSSTLAQNLAAGEVKELRLQSLSDLDKEIQREKVKGLVSYLSSRVLGLNVTSIDITVALPDLSFDSMSTVTLINVLQKKTGYRLPADFLVDPNRTLSHVIDHLCLQIPQKETNEDGKRQLQLCDSETPSKAQMFSKGKIQHGL